ncbi:hypothetical protein MRY82_02390 [bacterium]|nr:hypothetical protein [bacterium]
MVYLAIQVLFWMLAAFILGLVAGWWMKKVLWISPSVGEKNSDYTHAVQLADMQDRLREKQQTIDALQAQLTSTTPSKVTPSKKLAKTVKNSMNAPVTQETDDLKKIYGIGKVIESKLHQLGITKFEHVAQLSKADLKKVSVNLDAFKDRIERDNWVASAKKCHYEKYGKHI